MIALANSAAVFSVTHAGIRRVSFLHRLGKFDMELFSCYSAVANEMLPEIMSHRLSVFTGALTDDVQLDHQRLFDTNWIYFQYLGKIAFLIAANLIHLKTTQRVSQPNLTNNEKNEMILTLMVTSNSTTDPVGSLLHLLVSFDSVFKHLDS